MQGRVRNRTRPEAQAPGRFKQKTFGKGENSDLAPSQIGADQCALVENLLAFPNYLETRSGTKRFSDTAFPGSGTFHAFTQHPTSKKFLLHRGSKLYYADSAMAAWTEIKTYAASRQTPTKAGDASNQLVWNTVEGASSSNTNAGTLYWNLTNSGSTRTLDLYKDLAKTLLVATGARVGNGFVYLHQSNSSGLRGTLDIIYSGDDTDAANTLTVTLEESLGVDDDSSLRFHENNAVLFLKNASGRHICYIDLTNNKFLFLNGTNTGLNQGFINIPVTGSGTQAAGTPYGYRILFTLCRITNTSGALDSSVNRVTGTLEWEGPANGTYGTTDYGEFWVASPISGSASLSYNFVGNGVLGNGHLATDAAHHYTHVGIYRTMDIGTNGTDPVTGQGNIRDLYIWEQDIEISQETHTLTRTDDKLRADFRAGFGLKTRFMKEIPTGEVGEVTNTFLFSGRRGENRVYYASVLYKENMGYYLPAFQFFKLDDGLQLLRQSPDILTLICANKTYTSAYGNTRQDRLAQNNIPIITHIAIADQTVGVTDYGSFTEIESGTFIAVCSDRTVRRWNRYQWSEDLSLGAVNKRVQQFILGSTGAYIGGAYYLWFRTSAGNSYNDTCLRMGLGGNAGYGWSRMTGSAWVYPPTYTGATLTLNASSIQQLIVLDSPGAAFYIVPPFLGHGGVSLANSYFTDKITTAGVAGTAIAPKVRFREIVDDENRTLFHEESYVDLRDWTGAGTAPTSATLGVYVDGATSTTETVTYTLPGDLQFFKKIRGGRLQLELTWAAAGFQAVSMETLYQAHDVQTHGATAANTLEAGYQSELASNLKHWLCQPSALLNRATGTNYTLAGTAPTLVTGPNGKSYALSFVSGASYSQADTASYSDLTFMFWVKSFSPAVNNRILLIDGATPFYVGIVGSSGGLDVDGGLATISSIASGWHHLAVRRSGSAIVIYQNGAQVNTHTETGARGGATVSLNTGGNVGLFDDIRLYNAAVSANAIAYYYSDVVNNAGKKVLPLG